MNINEIEMTIMLRKMPLPLNNEPKSVTGFGFVSVLSPKYSRHAIHGLKTASGATNYAPTRKESNTYAA